MDVSVVGAGVVGLTCAHALERAGQRVRVVAAATGLATTSSVAGAIWLPYRCGPADRATLGAAATRVWLAELAERDPAAGVDLLTCYELADDDELPWWAGAAGTVERVAAPVTGLGARWAWRFVAPRVDPPVHLAWLAARLAAPIERRVVHDLAAEPGDIVVNCTGLGARALCGDRELVPLLGQVLVAHPGALDLGVSLGDGRDPDAPFYAIPRRERVILGGCALPWPLDDDPVAATTPDLAPADPRVTARIRAQAAALGLAPGAIDVIRTGLRPYRATVRLERGATTPRVVHCYGHGGAGFTLAHGCALDVAALLAASRTPSRIGDEAGP
jgi:D-amino-acid oxidase